MWPLPTISRNRSRSALEPSPRVIRPATSTTLTSPTCRVFNFTLTEYASWLKTAIYLDTTYLTKVTSVPWGSRWRISNSSIKDRMRKIPRPEVRIRFSGANGSGMIGHVEPFAFVGDPNRKPFGAVRHREAAPFYGRYSDCRAPRRSPSTPARPCRSSSDRLRRTRHAEPRSTPVLRRCRRSPASNPETVLRFPGRDSCFPAYVERP